MSFQSKMCLSNRNDDWSTEELKIWPLLDDMMFAV